MKQKFLLLLPLYLLLQSLFVITPAYAQHTYSLIAPHIMPIQPPQYANTTIFGENDYYTVTFRGNGEAVVLMKAIITNNTNSPLSSITLHFPSNNGLRDSAAYQVLAKPQCIQFSTGQINQSTCLQYAQPNYQYINDAEYQRISYEQRDSAIILLLKTPINPNDSGSYIFSYRTANDTHKNVFGAYNFTFQNFKVDSTINALQIGITTDSNLYLKDTAGNVQYSVQNNTPTIPQAVEKSVQNAQFSDVYNQIGQGDIVKTATSLSPEETYTVKGIYADAGIKLYGKEITITVLCIILMLLVIFGCATIVLKKRGKIALKRHSMTDNSKTFLLATCLSFASILIASGYTIGVFLASDMLNSGNYFFSENSVFFSLIVAGISGALYLLLLLTPLLIMTIKKGLMWGGITFGLTLMWASIASIILFGIVFLFFSIHNQPPVVYPMRGVSSFPASLRQNAK